MRSLREEIHEGAAQADGGLMSFQAKYPGRCGICGDEYQKGDWVKYTAHGLGKLLAHDFCHSWNETREDHLEPERVSSYTVRGRRNHEKPCGTCFLTHAGDCL